MWTGFLVASFSISSSSAVLLNSISVVRVSLMSVSFFPFSMYCLFVSGGLFNMEVILFERMRLIDISVWSLEISVLKL